MHTMFSFQWNILQHDECDTISRSICFKRIIMILLTKKHYFNGLPHTRIIGVPSGLTSTPYKNYVCNCKLFLSLWNLKQNKKKTAISKQNFQYFLYSCWNYFNIFRKCTSEMWWKHNGTCQQWLLPGFYYNKCRAF